MGKLIEIKNEIDSKCIDIKTNRNKKISHMDFDTIKSQYKDLDGISRKTINNILKLIYKFIFL